MKTSFSNNESFKELLRLQSAEIALAAANGLESDSNFRLLLSLLKAASERHVNNDFKYIIISEEDLNKLPLASDSAIDELFKNEHFIHNKHIVIDAQLSIIEANNDPTHFDNNETRRLFTQISKTGRVVFMISSNGVINYFVNGRDSGNSIFYNLQSLNSYVKKRPLSDIKSVLQEYRRRLTHRETYSKFFVEKSHLKSLRVDLNSTLNEDKFISAYRHLLRNKPEDSFRDDLRMFLKEKLQVHFVDKEKMLESLKRLDIAMYDVDGSSVYFIEVKWVGDSVHKSGKKIGTQFSENIVAPAIIQTTNYIKELSAEGVNVKFGYLAVFDARPDVHPDTGGQFSEDMIVEEDRKYLAHFEKLADFRVVNEHPN